MRNQNQPRTRLEAAFTWLWFAMITGVAAGAMVRFWMWVL